MKSHSVPLESQNKKTVHEQLDWLDFKWGEKSLAIKDTKYAPLLNFKFYPIN